MKLMMMRPSVRDAMLAAVPGLRAFAISLCGDVDRAVDLVQETLLRAMADIGYVPTRDEHVRWLSRSSESFRTNIASNAARSETPTEITLKALSSQPAAERIEFEGSTWPSPATAKRARSAHSHQRLGFSYEEARGHLRVRGSNNQEPGRSHARAALEALVGWERGSIGTSDLSGAQVGRRLKRESRLSVAGQHERRGVLRRVCLAAEPGFGRSGDRLSSPMRTKIAGGRVPDQGPRSTACVPATLPPVPLHPRFRLLTTVITW